MTDYTVSSGTASAGLLINPGDTLSVASGGSVANTTLQGSAYIAGNAAASLILNGGVQDVTGSATNTEIGSGGQEDVEGVSIGATIDNGGTQSPSLGGVASGATVLLGGFQGVGNFQIVNGVVSAGSAAGTQLSGGVQDVLAGSTATNTTVFAGGFQLTGNDVNYVAVGPDVTVGTVVNFGGTEVVGGIGAGNTFTETIGGQVVFTVSGDATSQVTSYGPAAGALAGYVVTLVQNGGEVFRTATDAGGAQVGEVHSQAGFIDLPAVASNTTVLSGGTIIFAGGTVQGLVVSSGGTEVIGGPIIVPGFMTVTPTRIEVSGNVVSSGVTEKVAAGGVSQRATVASGGAVIVLSGGTDLNTTVRVDAREVVSSGGVASNTTVFLSAIQVLDGGVSVSSLISSGGQQIVDSGGVASATMLLSSSYLDIFSGGSAVDVVDDESRIVVSSGGVAIGTMLTSGPLEIFPLRAGANNLVVEAGGTTSNTKIFGGSEYNFGTSISALVHASGSRPAVLYLGGVASGARVIGSGSTIRGGQLFDTVVSGGGEVTQTLGDISNRTSVLAGGYAFLHGTSNDTLIMMLGSAEFGNLGYTTDSAAVASRTIVSSGGTALITYDAKGIDTTVLTGGKLGVFYRPNMDTAYDTRLACVGSRSVVSQGATESVGYLGATYDDIIEGVMTVDSGGISKRATFLSGGQLLQSGRSSVPSLSTLVESATFKEGGSGVIYVGAATINDMVSSGGMLTVASGGMATSTVITDRGVQIVLATGSVASTQISSGGQETVSGASTSTTIFDGGMQTVLSGGVGTATKVLAGGRSLIATAGSAVSTTIAAGGSETVQAGGVASGTAVLGGGTETVSAGGLARGATVQGGAQVVFGSAVSSLVEGDGAIKVYGATSATQVAAGGVEIVFAGGTASGTTVGAGGAQGISAGGTAVDATILAGGLQRVHSGGTSINPLVFGTLINEKNDPVTSATIGSGGVQLVEPGAIVSGTHVLSGGTLLVLPGATPSGTIVDPGGTVGSSGVIVRQPGAGSQAGPLISGVELLSGAVAFVLSSGTALATTIDTGASEFVYAGGVTSGTTINGGLLDLTQGQLATGPLAFTSAGGTLEIDDVTPLATTLSGFVPGATIDLTALAFASGGTATLGAANLLTITEGGQTYAIRLTGDFSGYAFQVAPDSGTGTRVTAALTCFRRGTLLATPDGVAPVERLAPADLLLTRAGGAQPIVAVTHRTLSAADFADFTRFHPIRIAAGAFGPGLPLRDLYLSRDHAIWFQGTLIPARALIDGHAVTRVPVSTVDYHHVQLGTHDVILAEGLPCETFLPLAVGGVTPLHADHASRVWEAAGCAPLALTGPAVAAARALLARWRPARRPALRPALRPARRIGVA